MKKMLNEGNQIRNFISSSGSGTVINYGSGSDFLTSYGSGSGSASQKYCIYPSSMRYLSIEYKILDIEYEVFIYPSDIK